MDYIRRDILIRNIENDTRTILFCKEDALKYVRNALAEDVAPVRHGRWIKPVPGDGQPYCSECHVEQPWFYGYGYYHRHYCPNCGALMDGKEADREV